MREGEVERLFDTSTAQQLGLCTTGSPKVSQRAREKGMNERKKRWIIIKHETEIDKERGAGDIDIN